MCILLVLKPALIYLFSSVFQDIRALLLMFSVVPPRAMNPHFPPALQHILAACRRDREARLAEVSRVQRSEPEVTEKEEVNGEESDRGNWDEPWVVFIFF